jgi:hypothetical protein
MRKETEKIGEKTPEQPRIHAERLGIAIGLLRVFETELASKQSKLRTPSASKKDDEPKGLLELIIRHKKLATIIGGIGAALVVITTVIANLLSIRSSLG